MNQVKNLEASDSKDDETHDTKLFDCFLYGAKYYCSQNRANNTEIVFDICEQSHSSHSSHSFHKSSNDPSKGGKRSKQKAPADNEMADLGAVKPLAHSRTVDDVKTSGSGGGNGGSTSKMNKQQSQSSKASIIRSMVHENDFNSIQCENDGKKMVFILLQMVMINKNN